MTEKRFKNVNHEIWQNGEWWCSAGGEHCADVIATALNELTEENKQLKTKVDFYKYFQKDARELEKENEQLRKENKQLSCTIVEILDFIEDKREVSLEEMRRWWKEKEKELME